MSEPTFNFPTNSSPHDPSPLVQLRAGEPVADSRVIAEGFGIDHPSLCKVLNKHLSSDLKSELTTTPAGQSQKFYWLTEVQVLMLPAICKSSPELIRFQEILVNAFLALRAQPSKASPTLVESLEGWLVAEKARIAAESALAIAAPIVAAHKALTEADGTISLSELGNMLHSKERRCGQNIIAQFLRGFAVFKTNGNGVGTEPSKPYLEKGWFVMRQKLRTHVSTATGNHEVDMVTRVTQKGVVGIRALWVASTPYMVAARSDLKSDLAGGAS